MRGKSSYAVGKHQKSLETWKQYFGQKSPKKSEIFRPEYDFHVPAISGAFLPEPAHTSSPRNV
jgi:hypothetical protein